MVLSAPVAQLDRACGYEPQGREFESLRARQNNQKNIFALRSLIWIGQRRRSDL